MDADNGLHQAHGFSPPKALIQLLEHQALWFGPLKALIQLLEQLGKPTTGSKVSLWPAENRNPEAAAIFPGQGSIQFQG